MLCVSHILPWQISFVCYRKTITRCTGEKYLRLKNLEQLKAYQCSYKIGCEKFQAWDSSHYVAVVKKKSVTVFHQQSFTCTIFLPTAVNYT